MNYRDLLRKYMDLVVDMEGVSYLYREEQKTRLYPSYEPRFTPEEWASLKEIEAELCD